MALTIARWRFWRYLTADGNFVLDHLEINAPDVAVWLTNGAAFMTERTRFGEFIGKLTETDEVSRNRKAMNLDPLSTACRRQATAPNCVQSQRKTKPREAMTQPEL
jgi:hypothetical protein